MDGKQEILGRIRKALGRDAASQAELDAKEAALAAREHGPRPRLGDDLVGRFVERAKALSSTVDEASDTAAVPSAAARYLTGLALPMNGVCWPDLEGLDWASAGLELEFRAARGDDMVGITGVFCAIAETGTLMLLSGPRTPSSVSLLPETHVAMVSRARIVATLEDAWSLLRAEHRILPRAVNLVSGPSRTADIEQTVTLGAHGPYRVHLVLTP